ncbi:MAG: glutathione peroxidase [Deltaproteobacteria bacterium]|nr:glutathione peroxidase [Deltaproteobacteria bacterium]
MPPVARPLALLSALALAAPALAAPAAPSAAAPAQPVLIDHEVKTIDGQTVRLSDYRGKALLIVNTASFCGFTSQYADLKTLQDTYGPKGFTVLAFPCNDFGGQEPGSPEEIKSFCNARFSVNFPLFEKIRAKGPEKSPLYKTLTEQTADGIRGEVRWNFTKFLVNPRGEVVARFGPSDNPNDEDVRAAVEAALPR